MDDDGRHVRTTAAVPLMTLRLPDIRMTSQNSVFIGIQCMIADCASDFLEHSDDQILSQIGWICLNIIQL